MTDRLEGMKVAHQDEKQDYERQLAELRAEYTKTKDELDGEIMVIMSQRPGRDFILLLGPHKEAGLAGRVPPAEGAAHEQV